MAVDYSLPSFLNRPTDIVGPLTHGMQLGATIAQERNRLQMQAQTAAMEAQIRQEESQRRAVREQQQIEMEKARMQAEQGLRETALKQAQQKIDLSVKTLSRKFAAQQRYKQLIDSGADPAKALLEVGPDLGVSMTGAAALYKAGLPKAAMPPASVEEMAGQKFLKIPQPTGAARYQQIRGGPAEGGPIQAQPVLDPGTQKPIPGLVGVPTAGGGYTVHNVPDRQLRIAQARLTALEKDPVYGAYLSSDRTPTRGTREAKDAFAKRLETFQKIKKEYDRVKEVVEGALDQAETGKGTVAPYPEGTKLKHKDGSTWVVRGGKPVPMSDINAAPSHDEEPLPDEEEVAY